MDKKYLIVNDMLTAKKIIKAIGHPNLNLYRGKGYQYFVFDNGKDGEDMVFLDYPVYVHRINHLSLEQWVSYGNDCIKEVEKEFAI